MDKSSILAAACVLVICHISLVESYGSGAPPPACVTMVPGHLNNQDPNDPIDPSDDPSPYSLQVDKTMVTRGGTVEVTINGGEFGGFLLQARLSDGSSTDPVGTFMTTAANTKTTTCTATDDSATHSSPDAKPDGTTLTWMAPSMEFGNIKFMATVATNHDVFYVGHESSVVEYDPTEPTAEPEPTTQSASWVFPSLSAMLCLLIAVFALHY